MVHVVCFGNLWQGDDGFGVHLCRRLGGMRGWPPGVKVFDAGTAGLSALGYFEGCRKVVIVDALRTGGPVGAVRRIIWTDWALPGDELSVHAMGVQDVLAVLPAVFEGRALPEVVIIGAEVGTITPFVDKLTAPLEAALSRALRLVRRECMS
jgi:hydrogenase maturation protease